MRKLDALNKLYMRPPLNEHIERDFHKHLHDAWLALACLYDFLEACDKDGLLYGPYSGTERQLRELARVRDGLDQEHEFYECDWALDLPADSPEIIAAEKAYAERAAAPLGAHKTA
jgi:hypothetical protein